jgi:hypothetical protein
LDRRHAASGSEQALTRAQVDAWRSAGFAFVSGLFDADLLAQLERWRRFRRPTPNAAATFAAFGSGFTFASSSNAFNAITLHPCLLAARPSS